MLFRIWFYIAQVGVPVLFAFAFFSFAAPRDSFPGSIRTVAFCLLILLGIAGAFMGLLLVFGKLRMRCPFCGRRSNVGGSKADGMWLECESCGFVHGSGPFRLKMVRERIEDEG